MEVAWRSGHCFNVVGLKEEIVLIKEVEREEKLRHGLVELVVMKKKARRGVRP